MINEADNNFCLQVVLPTQAVCPKDCTESHYICNACLFQYILADSTKILPRCPAYGCGSKFNRDFLISLTRFDSKAFQKLCDLDIGEDMFMISKEFSSFFFAPMSPVARKCVQLSLFKTLS